jgi:predicted Zn-dependent protease
MLERQIGKLDAALQTLEEAIKKFPTFDKLYMIKGQTHQDRAEIPLAREAYAKGVKACPKSIPLWLLSTRLEEKAGITIKARALLEKARMQNPKNETLWAESVKVEERAGGASQAKAMLARGVSKYGQRDESLTIPLPCSPARLPEFGAVVEHGYLDGGRTAAKRAFGRCNQEIQRASACYQCRWKIVLE